MNALSRRDQVLRASRVAGEAALLSALGGQVKFLKSTASEERRYLERRLKLLEEFEEKVDKVDVRGDLSWYFEQHPILSGYNPHDGGIASSMSLLGASVNLPSEEELDWSEEYDYSKSSDTNKLVHELVEMSKAGESIMPNNSKKKEVDKSQEPDVPGRKHIQKWTSRIFASQEDIDKLEVEKRHKLELHGEGHGLLGLGKYGLKKDVEPEIPVEEAVRALINAVSPKGEDNRPCRSHLCGALNNERSRKTELSKEGYAALAEVMTAFLGGCNGEETANLKMMMMLSQSFYHSGPAKRVSMVKSAGEGDAGAKEMEAQGGDRSKRVFLKVRGSESGYQRTSLAATNPNARFLVPGRYHGTPDLERALLLGLRPAPVRLRGAVSQQRTPVTA